MHILSKEQKNSPRYNNRGESMINMNELFIV